MMDWQIKIWSKEVYIVNSRLNFYEMVAADDFNGGAFFYEETYDKAKASGCPREILKEAMDHYDRLNNLISV